MAAEENHMLLTVPHAAVGDGPGVKTLVGCNLGGRVVDELDVELAGGGMATGDERPVVERVLVVVGVAGTSGVVVVLLLTSAGMAAPSTALAARASSSAAASVNWNFMAAVRG